MKTEQNGFLMWNDPQDNTDDDVYHINVNYDACCNSSNKQSPRPKVGHHFPSTVTISPEHKSVVQAFVTRFHAPMYQQCLGRLYSHCGMEDPEAWGTQVYTALAAHPDDPDLLQLNDDRRCALQLVYDLVNAWKAHAFSESFEQAIAVIFQCQRLEYILGVTLVLDRAQALHKLHLPTLQQLAPGLHWYSKHHLDPVHSPLQPDERKQLEQGLQGYTGSPTMNWRLLRLCCGSPLIGLDKNPVLKQWCKPMLVPHLLILNYHHSRGLVKPYESSW